MAGKPGVGDHAAERALELTNVRTNAFRDEERDFLRQRDTRALRLRHENRDARFDFRRLDGDREAPSETGLQPFLQAVDLFRIAVAGEDDVVLAFEQRVERVEELFLRAILVREEL